MKIKPVSGEAEEAKNKRNYLTTKHLSRMAGRRGGGAAGRRAAGKKRF
jgi:hypothetical protein